MATFTYCYPQFKGIPEIGMTNNENEFTVTFMVCINSDGRAICEGADVQFYTNAPKSGELIAPVIGSIGGEIEVSMSGGQEAACRDFMDKWCARWHRKADDSVVGIYHIIREVMNKGRFIECL